MQKKECSLERNVQPNQKVLEIHTSDTSISWHRTPLIPEEAWPAMPRKQPRQMMKDTHGYQQVC